MFSFKRVYFAITVFATISSALMAQLQAGDAVMLTSTGLSLVRGGLSTPVVPVPIDGNALPAYWGDASVEWVPGQHAVLAGCDVAPNGLYYIDFTNSISSPTSKLIGLGVGGIRDIDVVPQTGDMLILQSITQGQGRIDILTAPVNSSSVLTTSNPFATNLPIANADYMAVASPTAVVVGGVANIYRVVLGSTGTYTTLTPAGAWFYSTESIDIDPVTGDLYVACFNPDYVRRMVPTATGMNYSDMGNVLAFPEVDGPDDVEFDALTGTVFALCRNGGQIGGMPVAVQPGNDNVIMGANPLAPIGTTTTTLTPLPVGNTGFFPNFTMVGTLGSAQVQIAGAGCLGSTGLPLTLTNNGMPVIGSPTFGLTLSNAPAASFSYFFLALGLAPAPIPLTATCNLFIDPVSMSLLMSTGMSPLGPLPTGGGSITLPTPIPNQGNLLGASISVQAACIDAVPGGFTTSNGLLLILGY